MHFIYLLFVLILTQNVINGQEITTCPDGWCTGQYAPKCDVQSDHCKGKDMKIYKNATLCGCCHLCLRELKVGEECVQDMAGSIPGTVCGPHLKCAKANKKSVCTKISDILVPSGRSCEKEAIEVSEITAGPPKPDCDEFGDYAPKLCRNGTLCHCVDKKGNRIFGSATYDKASDMDCLCSRQFAEVNDQLSAMNFNIDPVFFPKCQSNGNFEPFQVVDNYTYCVNTTKGEVLERAVGKRDVDQLSCKKQRYDYVSECEKEYMNATKQIREREDEGQLVVGWDVPKCDIDGTFAPVQCLNQFCYCVNKKGEKYRGTQVDRNDKLAINQTCNCVREMELIRDIEKKSWDKVTDLFAQYRCERNGNYLVLQCTESACYCVNPNDGSQIPPSRLKTNVKDIRKLPCYKEYEHKYQDIDFLHKTYPDVF